MRFEHAVRSAIAGLLVSCSAAPDERPDATLSDSGAPIDVVPVDELCVRAATVVCDAMFACCTLREELPPTLEACVSDQLALCRAVYFHTDQNDGLLSIATRPYDGAEAARVLDEIRARATTCEVARLVLDPQRFVDGPLAQGELCPLGGSARVACEDGLGCTIDEPGSVCQPVHVAGEACGDGVAHCERGTFCERRGASGTCTAGRANGAACATSDQCASESCQGGACVPLMPGQVYCAGAEWSG
ncbi:hypothetical protein [Sandaracinus amylolyticus]|uniref:hypothetical protein n=1 Tax=Sandaracinus amylolyticus TaxID=927083 RepID=UPI001F1DC48F|nr:hypothetical protein [Sandaracinus amylolyticus]